MENRHQPYDLAAMQSLPLEAKIRMTKERIEGWYESWCKFEIYDTATGKTRFVTIDRRDFNAEPPMKETEYAAYVYPGQVYVSFSGGKDSTVLKHIVDSMYDDVPAVFVNTGLEYPEIQNFVRDIKSGKYACFNTDIEMLRPEMRFDEVIKKYGYPVISKEVSQKIFDYRKNPNGWTKDRFDENSNYVKRYGKAYCLSKWKWLRDSNVPVSDRCCHIMKKTC